jgi:hypothetical protein
LDVSSDIAALWKEEEEARTQRRTDRPLSFYGRLTLSGRHVVFQKGAPGGKRDFDPEQDPEDAKRRALTVKVEPVSERVTNPYEREFVTSTPEGDLFRDSVVALGQDVPGLQGAYVRLDIVEDPRLGTYPDRTTGATRTRTAGLVREVFPDEVTCRSASEARYTRGGTSPGNGGSWANLGIGGSPSSPAAPAPVNAGKPLAPEAVPGVGKGLDRGTAAKFFPGVWQRAGGDPDKFLAEMAENKVMARHFDPSSPEVLEFLTKMGHPEFAAEAADKGEDDVDLEATPF